ncbi:MAG: peptidase U34 [Actinobacteria bacterium]|nr:peptidase U34 [Actinomycetota bacterium]
MCDTIVVVGDHGVRFAKNSDRDPNEGQALEWHAGAEHAPGATVQATTLEIPQAARTWDVLISRPFWMWGAEIGTNQHGVTIGNEAVFTDQPYAGEGLTGMDLLRLALERAATAEDAVEVIVSLMERHGQGGGCGHEHRSFTYHNSYLVADPARAFVLETAGRLHAVEEVRHGVRSISNGLTIPGFAEAHRDRLRSRVAACDVRTAITSRTGTGGPAPLMATLRSHGGAAWPRYGLLRGTLQMPCMHGGGLVAGSLSAASWVADLPAGRHWVTATSSPCLGLYKPVAVDTPVDLGPAPGETFDERTVWWRHERLARRVMRDPRRLAGFTAERDRVEAAWLADPPPPAEAFAEADRLTAAWTAGVEAAGRVRDTRPWWMRRYWRIRDTRAAMPPA